MLDIPIDVEALLRFIKQTPHGIPIHRVYWADKRPVDKEWPKVASQEEHTLRGWFQDSKSWIPAALTGQVSGLFVLDVDIKNGINGVETLEKLKLELPPTLTYETRNGGRHYLFCLGPHTLYNTAGALGAGIDSRGEGGYAILWFFKGCRVLDDSPIAMIPERLVAAFKKVSKKKSRARTRPKRTEDFLVGDPILEHTRNNKLFWIGMDLLKGNQFDVDGLTHALGLINGARCQPPLGDAEVQGVAKSCLSYAPAYVKRLPANLHDVMWWLDRYHHPETAQETTLAFNTMQSRLEWHDLKRSEVRGLCDDDVVRLRYEFEGERREVPLTVGASMMMDAIELFTQTHRYDPLIDYFNALTWDGTSRIDFVFQRAFGVDDNEYTRTVSRTFFIAAARRALQPGCEHRYLLVLIGREGIGKSTFCALICPRPEWLVESLPSELSSKAAIESIIGRWVVESAEMASWRRSDKEAIKSFVSRREDFIRLAYRRNPESFPRRCVIIATTNSEAPLSETDQDTRYLPIICSSQLDRRWLLENRDQLWAEAAHRLATDANWWKWDDDLMAQNRDAVREEDSWDPRILKLLEKENETTMDAVLDGLGIPLERRNRSICIRAGCILRNQGWSRHRRRMPRGGGGGLYYVYVRKNKQPPPDEAEAVDPDIFGIAPEGSSIH